MSKFYLMTGLSGSGKTTFVKDFLKVQENEDIRYISIDAFYYATFGNIKDHKHEFEVWQMCYQAINLAIRDGVNVIFDTNSPLKVNRDEIYEKFAKHFDEKYLIYMDTPWNLCLKNNAARDRIIPGDEMERMILAYERPSAGEPWDKIFTIKNNMNKVYSVPNDFFQHWL